jgi:hypothetical protein
MMKIAICITTYLWIAASTCTALLPPPMCDYKIGKFQAEGGRCFFIDLRSDEAYYVASASDKGERAMELVMSRSADGSGSSEGVFVILCSTLGTLEKNNVPVAPSIHLLSVESSVKK